MIITFTVLGTPKGKSRPRFTTRGKYVQTYQPKEDKVREAAIKAAYLAAAGNVGPHSGPVAMTIEAVFLKPESWSKNKKLTTGAKTSKPDVDNIAKLVQDALNKVAYLDDAQIVRVTAHKRFGDTEETIVSVERIGATADLFASTF